METRLAAAGCLVLGCALTGRALADATRRRARTLYGLTEGLRLLRIHMTGMLEPVQNALRHTNCAVLEAVAEQMKGGTSAWDSWQAVKPRVTRRGGSADALTDKDLAALEQLLSRLGQSGREEQGVLLNGACLSMQRLWEDARSKAEQADKLYTSLGLLIGIMLALIVI